VIAVLGHPLSTVRMNLEDALLRTAGGPDLELLLDNRDVISAEVAATARAMLAADGVDLAHPATPDRRTAPLSYLPNYDDWPVRSDRPPPAPRARSSHR
jgi:hypothetical protein